MSLLYTKWNYVLRLIFYTTLLILFPVMMQKTFPYDIEKQLGFIVGVIFIILMWLLLCCIFFFYRKQFRISHLVFILSLFIACLIIYNMYPWHRNFTGYKLIKEYVSIKKSKEINLEWQYELSPSIENYSRIALSQQMFKKINPEKYYNVEVFSYDNKGIQQYKRKYIIYFIRKIPYTTKPEINFKNVKNYMYQLKDVIDDSTIMLLNINNGNFDLSTEKYKIQIVENENIEIYYKNTGIYYYEIKRQNNLNISEIKERYLIYKLIDLFH